MRAKCLFAAAVALSTAVPAQAAVIQWTNGTSVNNQHDEPVTGGADFAPALGRAISATPTGNSTAHIATNALAEESVVTAAPSRPFTG